MEYILGFGAAVVIVLTIIIILILYLILQCRLALVPSKVACKNKIWD